MKLTADRLSESIVAWANTQLAIGRETCAILDELHRDFGLTDREIRDELGLEHLYMDDKPNETDERPLLHFSFIHRRYFDTTIEVDAHDEQEAQNLAETEAEDTSVYDMDCYVWETERITD